MSKSENPFQFSVAEESSGFLLWQVTSLWQREIRKALSKFDLTHAQFVLLASVHWLTLGKQEVTQVLLSNHSKIDPMTTSQVLRTLQAKGLIKRQEHSTDTRAKMVALTEAGVKLVKPAVKAVEQFDNDFFKSLGSGTADFNKKLLRLLAAVK